MKLYVDHGGIEVLQTLKGSGWEMVPREQLFLSHERNQAAINLAFEGFSAEEISAAVQ